MTIGQGQDPSVSEIDASGDDADDEGQQNENQEAQRSRLSREDLESELRKTRREAAGYRRQLRDLQNTQQGKEQETGNELQKLSGERETLRTENESLKAQLQQERGKNRVSAVAGQLGFRNPNLAHRLLDVATYDFNDPEVDKDLTADLRRVLRENPYLAGTAGGADGGEGRNGTPPGRNDMSSLIRHAAGR